MAVVQDTRLQLCGSVLIELDGRRLEDSLPSRQGAQLFVYLALNRHRPVSRDELIEALWPYEGPADPEAALRTLLSRLRKAIGADLIEGRSELRLRLPPDAWVDWEAALEAQARAEEAIARSDWGAAWGPAQVAVSIAERGFLPGHDAPWIDERRRELEELRLTALEYLGRTGLGIGERELAATERAARALIEAAPYRESGHLYLMQVLAARGNPAQALRVYDELRVLLRDELGTAPGPDLQAAHRSVLDAGVEDERVHVASLAASASAAFALPRALAIEEQTRLVGRDEELGWLEERLAASARGGVRFVLLTGEAGVGKTRLAADLGRSAHADGAAVLYGRFGEEALLPFEGIVEALRDYVAHAPLEELERRVEASGHELAELLPQLKRRLPHATRSAEGNPATRRYRVFEAVATLLDEIARSRPLLMILDDLHWADHQTTLMLAHLVRRSHGVPFLIVGVSRAAEIGQAAHLNVVMTDLRAEGRAERRAVEGLGEDAVAELVEALAGCPPSPPLVRTLEAHTEGNPFFLREVTRHLLETGAMHESDGRLRLRTAIENAGLPEAVEDVIRRRLSRLGDETQLLMSVAAVVGRRFDPEILQHVVEWELAAVVGAVEEALEAGVVMDEPHAPGLYSFSHGLISQTLYTGVTSARRTVLHEQIGDALEHAYAPNIEPHLAEIAHHFLHATTGAQALAKAMRYGAQAARRATELYANEEAVSLYERTLERVARASPEARALAGTATREISSLEEGLGDALEATGEHENAAAAYERALAGRGPVERARLQRKLGAARTVQRVHAGAEEALAAAEAALSEVPEAERGNEWQFERIEVTFAQLTLGYWQGKIDEMDRLIDEERARVEAEGTPGQLARLLLNALMRNLRRDRYAVSDETLALARSLLAAVEADGDPYTRGNALFNVGFTYLWAGEAENAAALFRRALECARRGGGDVTLRSRCLVYLSIALRRLGDTERTRDCVEEALPVVQEGNMVEYVGTCRANRAWLALRDGDLDAAREQAHAALAAWRELPFVYAFQSTALWPLLEAALADGDLDEAIAGARRLLDPELQAPPPNVAGLLTDACNADGAGRRGKAAEALERALEAAGRAAVT